jgi:tRNA threonylcarbamoyladenosine biosynthesis protein TsaB
MAYYITLSNTYELVELGLFHEGHLIDSVSDDKMYVSKNIVVLLQELLAKNNKQLADLSFIAANQGPAPYTTLRVVLSTVNGLSFSTGIPLIGLDGLELFAKEFADDCFAQTVILHNAFNQELYYALAHNQGIVSKGYGSVNHVIDIIKNQFSHNSIRFLGNGYNLHAAAFEQAFGSQAYIPTTMPTHPSLAYLGAHAYDLWHNQANHQTQLFPLYLKQVQIF